MPRLILLLIVTTLVTGCGQQPADSPEAPAADPDGVAATDDAQEPDGDPDNEAAEAPAASDWHVEYDRMNAVLDLSEQEQSALQAAYLAREEEHSTWMAANGRRLVELEQQMKKAAKSRDLGGVRAAKAKATPLRTELRELLARHEAAITGALTPDNQSAWAAAGLAERLLELMTPLNLTEDQIAQIYAEAAIAVQKSANEPNPSAAGFIALEKGVEVRVLKAEQKDAYAAVKKKNPMRSLR